MKEIKSFWKGVFYCLVALCVGALVFDVVDNMNKKRSHINQGVTDTEFGSFLAAQHALFVNDFDAAAAMIQNVKADIPVVNDTKGAVAFFDGKIPDNIKSMKDEKDLTHRLIYDAHLVQQDDWKSVYQRHNKDSSMFFAPLRIFSAVNQGKTKDALSFIDSLKVNKSWKAFMRGQIAVLNNDIDKAAKEFADVHPDFMNINDYLYLMSFYKENGMTEDMDILRNDFMAKPAGMFILNYKDIPDWSNYTGYKNNLVFSIIQTISHTQIMIFTDLSLLMLRFADVVSNESNIDAINYYMGQYYFYNSGDYEKSFNKISKDSPLYLFGQMKIAEKTGNFKDIERIAYKNPLFISAVDAVVTNNIKNGKEHSALRLINRALRHKDLTDTGRTHFLKQRAHVYLMFNQPKNAQKDLKAALDIDDRLLPDVLLLQARIWAMENRNLDDAYNYAMMLVKRNTSDVIAWDMVGILVEMREGVDTALELMERVGEVSVTTSSLFEHLGDFYVKKGDTEKAKKSYLRAIDLADDGLIVVPFVQKKIRKLK